MLPGGRVRAPPALRLPRGAMLASPRVVAMATHGFAPAETAFMLAVLNDTARGWGAYGYRFVMSPPAEADFDMHLASPRAMAAAFPDAALAGMSVTDRRGARPVVYLHSGNWDAPPRVSGYGARDVWRYRAYLVAHEVGHVLGAGHATCGGDGEPAPVMLQQTKGCGACYPDPAVVKMSGK